MMTKMLTALGFLLSAGMVVSASTASVEAGTVAFEMDKLPYKAAWGAYTVTVDPIKDDSVLPQQLLRIRDGSGKVLREIDTSKFDELKLLELSGKGAPELFVSAWDGGAHCCFKGFVFTRDGGLRNLLILDLGNGHVMEFKDLNSDGRPEIIASNDVLSTLGLDLPYSVVPWMNMVIGWDGNQYVDQTRRYPQITRPLIRRYQSEFEKVEGIEGTIYGEDAEVPRRGTALGYYVNSLLVGEGSKAKAWLHEHAPDSTMKWLTDNEALIAKAIDSTKDRISVSQKPSLSGWRLGE